MIPNGLGRIVYGLLAWILGSIALLAGIGLLTVERLFVASLIGFLAVRELTSPQTVSPRWRTRLNWMLGAGLVIFAILMARQILALV